MPMRCGTLGSFGTNPDLSKSPGVLGFSMGFHIFSSREEGPVQAPGHLKTMLICESIEGVCPSHPAASLSVLQRPLSDDSI